MNIKITHNWLLEYLETDATPYEIQKYLSLCGPSIETIEKVGKDYVYDIEITSNRIDSASVFGISQECQAILPMFGKKAKLKYNPLEKWSFKNLNSKNYHRSILKIKTDPRLNPRFTAIVLSNIKIAPSPDFIKERLTLSGVKSINNVVDVSNYLMLTLGQPCHIFDYDKIFGSIMIVRESRKGEKLITLDEKIITLPGGDIVIEDGEGKLIDLCGIMGGLNSAVSEKTKNIVLFLQIYDKAKIRKTSMITGQRTVASSYFEKGLDPERVEPAFVYGLNLLEKFTGGKSSSPSYDIYPNPTRKKTIFLSISDVDRIIGVRISKEKIVHILTSLGFNYQLSDDRAKMVFEIPSYRQDDISIKEDLIEEIARVYGYHNLPNNLQPQTYIAQPKETEILFEYQTKIKYFLKHLGLNETMNYSMISKEMIENIGLTVNNHLSLSNSISEDIKYLRTEIFSSLIKNIRDNAGKKSQLRLFEIAKTYLPRDNDLPDEKLKLAVVVNTSFSELKGIVESLFKELNIENSQVKNGDHYLLAKNLQGEIVIDDIKLGIFGQLNPKYQVKNNLKNEIFLAEIDFTSLAEKAKIMPKYKSIHRYAVIKLDLTLETKKSYENIKTIAFKTSKMLQNIEFIDKFKDKLTLRFYFSSNIQNIIENQAKEELKKITLLIN